jgi:hypothetical protein
VSKPAPHIEDDKVKNFIAALNTGHYLDRAARLAEIAPATVYQWLDKGATARRDLENNKEISKSQKSYLEIADAIVKAREAAAHRALVTIQQAAKSGTWQAAAWYLERTDREHYGRVTQFTGSKEEPLRIAVSVEEVEKLLSEIAARDNDE